MSMTAPMLPTSSSHTSSLAFPMGKLMKRQSNARRPALMPSRFLFTPNSMFGSRRRLSAFGSASSSPSSAQTFHVRPAPVHEALGPLDKSWPTTPTRYPIRLQKRLPFGFVIFLYSHLSLECRRNSFIQSTQLCQRHLPKAMHFQVNVNVIFCFRMKCNYIFVVIPSLNSPVVCLHLASLDATKIPK